MGGAKGGLTYYTTREPITLRMAAKSLKLFTGRLDIGRPEDVRVNLRKCWNWVSARTLQMRYARYDVGMARPFRKGG